MCTLAVAGLALSAASTGASFIGQQQATSQYNQSVLNNAESASEAAAVKYNDEQRKYTYDQKNAVREGYDAALKTRSTVATGVASAGDAGIDASSISLANLISDVDQRGAENQARVKDKMSDTTDAYSSRVKSIDAQARGQIAAMPMKEGPSALSLGLGIAGDAGKYGVQQGWFKS